MALDATVKGTSANSYSTQADATTYFGDRLGVATWTSAASGDKDSSLVMATRFLDQMMWKGERTTTTQALSYPRQFLPDPDATAVYWGQQLRLRTDYFDSDAIPNRMKFSVYELAFRLLSDNELLGDPSLKQFKGVDISGVLAIQIDKAGLTRVIDRNILNFISPLLRSGDAHAVPLKR